MKFGQYLALDGKPEWRSGYLDYGHLKRVLYSRIRQRPKEMDEAKFIQESEIDFFKQCNEELRKVANFYRKKLLECRQKCTALEMAVASSSTSTADPTHPGSVWTRVAKFVGPRRKSLFGGKGATTNDSSATRTFLPPKNEKQLKLSSEEFYFELECLKNFRDENVTGFRKILKKHDKLWKTNRGGEWHKNKVLKSHFVLGSDVEKFCQRVERVRIDLEHGDRKQAMERLRVPSTAELQSERTKFCSGFFWALFTSTFFTAVICGWYTFDVWWRPPWVIVRLYRGFFSVLLMATLTALNMNHWRRTGVNYVLIFELSPRRHVTSGDVFAMVAVCWSLWTASLLGYFVASTVSIPRLWFPLILAMVYALLLVQPFKCCCRESRFWLLGRIFRCLAAPFCNGSFFDLWLADQMCSMVTVVLDTHYFICFYATQAEYVGGWIAFKHVNETSIFQRTGYNETKEEADYCTSDAYGIRPILSLLPTFIRLSQCIRRYYISGRPFPNFYNAIKYFTVIPVITFGALFRWHSSKLGLSSYVSKSPFFHIWVLCYGVSFAYAFLWDIRVDWCLIGKKMSDHWLLRPKLVYHGIWIYYAAMVLDCLGRTLWIVQVSLKHSYLIEIEPEALTTAMAVLECFRRCVWSAIRLENEHLNNVEGLRVSRNVLEVPWTKLTIFGTIKRPDLVKKVVLRVTKTPSMSCVSSSTPSPKNRPW